MINGRRSAAGLFIASVFWITSGYGEGVEPVSMNLQQLKVLAQQHEQAGEKQAAAEAYEVIISRDPSLRGFLAARLAVLYAETGATNQALSWAREAASTNPDPEADLAGIHVKLGDLENARTIFENLVQQEVGGQVMLAHFWQLAEVYEKLGQLDSAESLLKRAYEIAPGPAEKDGALLRWNQFKRSHVIDPGPAPDAGNALRPPAPS